MLHIKSILRLLLCISYSLSVSGQEGKIFTTGKELSSSMINQVSQDSKGVIWICTEDGLNRYDGAKFTVFRHQASDEHSLIYDYVRFTFEDSQKHFFVGTLNGIQLYERDYNRFFTLPLHSQNGEIKGANFSSIVECKDGSILAGSSGHGVFRFIKHQNGWALKQELALCRSFFINALYEDRKERIWILSGDKGLFAQKKDGSYKQYLTHEKTGGLSSICEDAAGNIYVGSLQNGLYQYEANTDQFRPIPYPISDLPVKTLYPVGDTELLIGTDGNGVKVYDTRKRVFQENRLNVTTLAFDRAKVHSITKDRRGNFWLGCFQKGVVIVPAVTDRFKYIGAKSATANSIGTCCVMSLCHDQEGTLWVGTDNDGIYAITSNGKQKLHLAPKRGKHSVPPTIMSLCEDSNRQLWIGAYRNGLFRLNTRTKQCESIHLPTLSVGNEASVFAITEDKQKQLWVGTMGLGLYRINLRTNQIDAMPRFNDGVSYNPQVNRLPNGYITSLLCDSKNRLYLGTYDGLGCLDIAKMNFVSTYGTNRLLPGEVVYALYEDQAGNIWIGTAQGLKCLNTRTQQFKSYTMADGLPGNSISAIKGDNEGHLWISTNYGISRFHLKDKTFMNFYAGDGLQSNEFTKGTVSQGAKGEICFGGTDGITLFTPRDITSPGNHPEIRISDFYIHDRPVHKGMKSGGQFIVNSDITDAEQFQLSYEDNSFSIEFSAMEFYNPERITFLYNFNHTGWIQLQPGVNRVSFSNLDPGSYDFEVKAKDYTTFSTVKKIQIVLSPPWWSTWWAKSIYTLGILGILVLVALQIRHRYRTRQQMMEHLHAEEINESKLQFFINISHEIRTPMSLIISPLQKLIAHDTNPERQHSYAIIYRNAERILRLINQLMDVRKIDKGQMQLRFKEVDIIGWIHDLCHTFDFQASERHISFCCSSDLEALAVWIDPKNFDKVMLNLLSNAFKFTPEQGSITISLSTGEDINASTPALQHYVEIRIKDTGIGIEEEEMSRIFDRFYQTRHSNNLSNTASGTGIGLHLTRSLIALHHGEIHAENNMDEKGCCFICRLPLGCDHLSAEEFDDDTQEQMAKTETICRDKANEEAESSVRSKSKYHIVIAEDDDEIRHYLTRELSPDFHIHECRNGKEALTCVLQRMPDLLVSDVMMPEMDGISLCRKIKQNVNINHIPIILLTAKTREEDTLEGLSRGADAYITKPFNIEIVRQTIHNLIQGRELLRNSFCGHQQPEKLLKKLQTESPNERFMNRIMTIINNNLSNPELNVEMIASEVGISRVHLHRKLKELTNQSTRDFIRNARLQQAANLLTGKQQSISEVANLTGFTNMAYFSTAFKDLFGVSPTEYINQRVTAPDAPSTPINET